MTAMKKTLETVHDKIITAFRARSSDIVGASSKSLPCLVAVSKLKPSSSIVEAYQCGQRHFGENYIQELVEKSNSSDILEKCPDIRFHFIGHLQSNKVNKLIKVKNLHMIQSIDSIKLADVTNKAYDRQTTGSISKEDESKMNQTDGEGGRTVSDETTVNVLIQVNTSGETAKSGIQPEDAPNLAQHIMSNCKRLHLSGLMTIGKLDGWGNEVNKDFLRLFETRSKVAKLTNVPETSLELSMGMSNDFEEAILMGSTMVRIGTMIFGERPPKSQ